jgi:hypothetical protein
MLLLELFMKLCRVASALLLCAAFLAGQTNRGGIAGSVLDPSGAAVPGATIIVKNVGTNAEIKTKTSPQGEFSVQNLDPVTYNVTAEAQGFKRETVDNVKVDTTATANVILKLQTGAVSTTVSVEASAAMINTESGTTSSVVTQREIQDLPLTDRSVLDLALTQPNVSGDVGSENPVIVSVTTCPGCNVSLNGGRSLSTTFLADGANNTGVSLSRTMVSFSPETVQEFTVQTTAYSAEYGTTGGGVINATTRSGTNQFSGTALWYNRNPDFAAAPFTLATINRSPPTLKYNQFSLAAGGPVYIPKIYNGKNKTFWFAAYEPNYRRDFLAQDANVQTPAERAGDWSNTVVTSSGTLPASVAAQYGLASTGDATIYNQFSVVNGNQFVAAPVPASGQTYTPFPGNIIPPSLIDSTYLKTLQYYAPAGQWYIGTSGAVENLYNPRTLQQDEKRITIKVDEILTSNDHISARWTLTPIVKMQFTPNTPTSNQDDYSHAQQSLLTYTKTISPTMVNDFRLNYTRGVFSLTEAEPWDPTNGINLNTLLGLPSILHGGVPGLPDLGGQGSTENNDVEERYSITNILYKTHGNMSIKIGGDINKALQNVLPLYAAIGGVYSFSAAQTNSAATNGTGGNSFASFELGVPSGITFRTAEVPYYYRWWSYDGFVQDDWKLKPNFTLNLGIRYNLEMPRTEKYNNQGVFLPQLAQTYPIAPMTLADGSTISSVTVPPFAYSGRGGNSRYLLPPDYKDFEPRFGFAWSPGFLKDYHVVVRGGYALSHSPISGANRLPSPDFGATAGSWSPTSGQTNPAYIMRLGENPPALSPVTPAVAVGAPANGLLYNAALNSSLNLAGLGYAVSPDYHTPYVQNWNFTLSWQALPSTAVEIAYVGSKGTHLFEPREDLNPRNLNVLNAEEAQNIATTTASIPDPLGRVGTNGKVINIQPGSLGSPYLGFSSLYMLYDASANSHREAGYVSVVHRGRHGLTLSSNFTWGKSIDDSSSQGGDKNVLTNVGGQSDGLVAFGASRSLDRSVSTFDQRFTFNNSLLYDVPLGRGRQFLAHAPRVVDWALGGWTTSNIIRVNDGFPATATLSDNNLLGDPSETHTARPNIVPGVPLINPLFNINCPTGTGCQPYLNPAAFERPPVGTFGDAPRTLDGARGPWAQFWDLSVQKNFRLNESGKRRLQFRVDFLNVLNHPIFRTFPNNAGGTDFMGAPSTATISTSSYNTWATANGQPAYSATVGSPGYVEYNQIVSNVNSFRNSAGVLPNDFFTVPLPNNFFGISANSYDIRTTQGYKLYQLRTAYNAGFGDLYQPNSYGSTGGGPRYIQFGLKLYF